MVNANRVIDVLRSLSLRQSEAPTTGDIAAALNCTAKHVRAIVADLVASGAIVRVGHANRPGLVVADSMSPQVRRLRALIARVEARHAAEFAAELAELRALEAELVTVPGRMAVAS